MKKLINKFQDKYNQEQKQNEIDELFTTNKLFNQKIKQIYVEESSKIRDSFILDSFQILKSLNKKFVHLLAYY